jgi:hypothetical protein
MLGDLSCSSQSLVGSDEIESGSIIEREEAVMIAASVAVSVTERRGVHSQNVSF